MREPSQCLAAPFGELSDNVPEHLWGVAFGQKDQTHVSPVLGVSIGQASKMPLARARRMIARVVPPGREGRARGLCDVPQANER